MNMPEVLKQVESKLKSCETYLSDLRKKTASVRTKKPAK